MGHYRETLQHYKDAAKIDPANDLAAGGIEILPRNLVPLRSPA